MPYKFNPFTKKLDYYKNSVYVAGSNQLTPMSLVFYEEFTGDGGTTEFILNGNVLNATFGTGLWTLENTKIGLPINVTSENNLALYDSSNIFSRNRISVNSYSKITGIVTLDYPPILLETFRIWYWYDLKVTDVLTNYYRPDFVASMEADTCALIAGNINVNTANFDTLLSISDTDVQKALETLDGHEHGTAITDTQIDDIDLSSFYIGYATNSATVSDPYWQIFKIVENYNTINIFYADGTEYFDKTWDNRLSYIYN